MAKLNTVVNLNAIPSQDWVMLRVADLEVAHRRIASGDQTVEAFENYCAAIRFSVFEYGAYSRRIPGSFDNTAQTLVALTEEVLGFMRSSAPLHGNLPIFGKVVDAVTRHKNELEESLRESRKASAELCQRRIADAKQFAALVAA